MTQAIATEITTTNAWPIDTSDRILTAMAGSEGTRVIQVAIKTRLSLSIVVEWLTDRVKQGLLIYDDYNATYRPVGTRPATVANMAKAS